MTGIPANEAKNYLCNNLSAIDLKQFLISVQRQFDQEYIVKKKNQNKR